MSLKDQLLTSASSYLVRSKQAPAPGVSATSKLDNPKDSPVPFAFTKASFRVQPMKNASRRREVGSLKKAEASAGEKKRRTSASLSRMGRTHSRSTPRGISLEKANSTRPCEWERLNSSQRRCPGVSTPSLPCAPTRKSTATGSIERYRASSSRRIPLRTMKRRRSLSKWNRDALLRSSSESTFAKRSGEMGSRSTRQT